MLFLDLKKKFLYVLFSSFAKQKSSVTGIMLPVRTVKYFVKVSGIKKIYRLFPVCSGKIGKMKEIFYIPKTGLQSACLYGHGIRDHIFSLIGYDPEFSLQGIPLGHS